MQWATLYLRMPKMKWFAIASALILIYSCFLTWVTIKSKGIIISGVAADGTSFGKPGYMHLLLASITIILLLIPRVLSIRIALFITAFNTAWAIRNFVLIPTCYAGVCPQKHVGIYLMLLSSICLLIGSLLAGSIKTK